MRYYLVEFACFRNDPIKVYLLDELTYDRWCMCEPQEGYKRFKLLMSADMSIEVYEYIKGLLDG